MTLPRTPMTASQFRESRIIDIRLSDQIDDRLGSVARKIAEGPTSAALPPMNANARVDQAFRPRAKCRRSRWACSRIRRHELKDSSLT